MKTIVAQAIQEHGFTYWQEFMIGRRGNPWFLKPTPKMISVFEVYGLSKQNKVTGELETYEVIFDEAYALGWLESQSDIVALLKTLNPEKEKEDLFQKFEESCNIVPGSKNPRHTLYLKFKDYCNDSNNRN